VTATKYRIVASRSDYKVFAATAWPLLRGRSRPRAWRVPACLRAAGIGQRRVYGL